MNIFMLDSQPSLAAQYHADTHVRKMIVESAQLMSTAYRILEGEETFFLDKRGAKRKTWVFNDERDEIFYKSTHYNHPSAKWVREAEGNYLWTYFLFLSLLEEYTYRFDKIHKSVFLRKHLYPAPKNMPDMGMTPIKYAFDKKYIISNDPVENYRNYYIQTKQNLLQYTRRNVPNFILEAGKNG